jgi:hypothetical protein
MTRRNKLATPAGKATALMIAAALVLSTAPVLPRGWEAAALAARPGDETDIATYQLKRLSADDYADAIGKALAKHDADLADSLRALAERQGVKLSAAQIAEVDAALAEEHSRMASDAWQGFISGNAENEPALAGAIAADLSGYGDLRDLYTQAGNYVAGVEVDTTTVALAAVGLTLTVATVMSLGATAPEKAGVSTIKVVNRLGRLSKPLRRQIIRLGSEAVDTRALREVGESLTAFDLTAMRGAASRIVRPAEAARLKTLGADVATLGENAGYRGTLEVLAKAEDTRAISRMARLSKRFGKATRGALFMLGDAAFTLAAIAGTVFSWMTGAAFWLLAAVWIAARFGVWALRVSFAGLWWTGRRLAGAAAFSGAEAQPA